MFRETEPVSKNSSNVPLFFSYLATDSLQIGGAERLAQFLRRSEHVEIGFLPVILGFSRPFREPPPIGRINDIWMALFSEVSHLGYLAEPGFNDNFISLLYTILCSGIR